MSSDLGRLMAHHLPIQYRLQVGSHLVLFAFKDKSAFYLLAGLGTTILTGRSQLSLGIVLFMLGVQVSFIYRLYLKVAYVRRLYQNHEQSQHQY